MKNPSPAFILGYQLMYALGTFKMLPDAVIYLPAVGSFNANVIPFKWLNYVCKPGTFTDTC